MRDSRPQSLDTLLDDNAAADGILKNVQQRAVALLRLDRAVQALLPTPLQPFCRVANFRQGVLVLEVANASWLMRLRYEQSRLLSALRAEILPSLSSIDTRINPDLMRQCGKNAQSDATPCQAKEPETVMMRTLSTESAQQLRWLASQSPEGLRKKLERLAALAGESTDATSRNKNRRS
ncbi:hypothetical protein A9798_13300 [Edwardsiella hoshinae]|uniref:Zn-ribbon-containing, possibly RNA-binding protein and truncated derivatives n=1 Tax=Edwardsiella hoshinae TaxID=93378 RepID=A0A376DK11_9GAMM|nr:DciA family protein [Edwardsiella hoshinae]AOV97824.1 hypothetical protein A9798_13300 [Edwardsiella hoshinae]QPR29290.1 DUF721 domain-containing protein [Edwardsiella hoshinae]STC90846.1 Zn-ribbon-containing, possibly RNA-binding protein and truncated derivatives [Edwardsiella hoshinae]